MTASREGAGGVELDKPLQLFLKGTGWILTSTLNTTSSHKKMLPNIAELVDFFKVLSGLKSVLSRYQ